MRTNLRKGSKRFGTDMRKAARSIGTLRRWSVRRGTRRGDEHGQSSVEFAILLAAFAAMLAGLAAVWHFSRDGRLVSIATQAASHSFGDSAPYGAVHDIIAF